MTETPVHVLIIDDEEIIREALDALLTKDGCVVRTAATAAVPGLELAPSGVVGRCPLARE